MLGTDLISFVILHYQALEETLACVHTIQELVNDSIHIVIVDNASPNGSGAVLKKEFARLDSIDVILLDQNLGFAKGNNVGFRLAREAKPDFIVVMNNDVFIQQDNFAELVNQSYLETGFGILGPDIYSTKINAHQNPQRNRNYTLSELKRSRLKLEVKRWLKPLLRIKYAFPRRERVRPGAEQYGEMQVGVVLHGACYIFSKDFIDTHQDCFFEKTFMYYESYILHYLAQLEGIKLVYDPSIKVLHHEDVATDQTFGRRYKKAVFVNDCLLDSCNVFIQLIEESEAGHKWMR